MGGRVGHLRSPGAPLLAMRLIRAPDERSVRDADQLRLGEAGQEGGGRGWLGWRGPRPEPPQPLVQRQAGHAAQRAQRQHQHQPEGTASGAALTHTTYSLVSSADMTSSADRPPRPNTLQE